MPNKSVGITKISKTLRAIAFVVLGCVSVHTLLISGQLQAAEWDNTFSVSANAVYTTNESLSESDEESDFIPTIAGNWTSRAEGGRVSLKSIGSLEFNDAGGSGDSRNLKMQTDAKAELIERNVFLDAALTASQNAIDPLAISGDDNLSNTTNKTTTYATRISPYVVGRIKRYADFLARFTYNYVTNTEIDDGDTSSRSLDLSLNSGTEFGRLSWGVSGNKRTTETETGSETDRSSVNVNLGYQINRRWRITGSVGQEWTDFTSNGDTDGMSWEVGTVWTPSARTTFDVGYGKRFTGSSGHLDFSHRSRKSIIKASYSQDITDTNELLANQVVFIGLDPFGNLFDPITGQPVIFRDGAFFTTLTNNAQILNDRFTVSYTLQGKRTRFNVDGNYTKQTGSDSSETEGYGIGVAVSRDLSGLLSANASLSFDKQILADDSETDLARLNIGLDQKLGKKTSVSMSYSHSTRETDATGSSSGDYDEDRVTLSVRHNFD